MSSQTTDTLQEVRVPEIGENIASGEVVKVLVSVGDVIALEQPIAELETDKAVVELPSSAAGRVAKVLMKAGDSVTIGQVVLQVEAAGAAPQAKSPALERRTAAAPAETPAPPRKAPAQAPTAEVVEEPPPTQVEAKVLPRYAAGGADVAASPAVRRLARELGVDLSRVIGNGTGGRISSEDVKEFVRHALAGLAAQPQEAPERPAAPSKLPDFSVYGAVDREPLSKVRKITGKNMTASWTTIPQVTQHDQADITQLEAFRRQASPKVEEAGGKLTITAILTKVCAGALTAFPRFNSSLDVAADALVIKRYYNIGIAVDTESGLIVPVVKEANLKSLTQISIELHDLASRTRERKVRPDELEGGSFTISNLGGIGGTGFSPIVFAPQVAILGVSRTQNMVRMVEGIPQERAILPLALTYDHRVIDGAEGARFLRWVCEALENPYLAVLGA